MSNSVPYTSPENFHQYLAMHRKVLVNNCRNTDNVFIQCTFDEIDSDPACNIRRVMRDLIEDEYAMHGSDFDNTMPLSAQLIWHRMHLDWVNILERMVFIEGSIGTFHAEYSSVINSIITTTNPGDIDFHVYRYSGSGSTLFHMTAKMFLLHERQKIYGAAEFNLQSIMDRKKRHVQDCYSKLGEYIDGNSETLLSITDDSGKSLREFISDYVEELVRSFRPSK